MNETLTKQIESNLVDMAEAYKKLLRDQFKGHGWKTHSMNDAEFRVWFEAMIVGNPMLGIVGNPNWVRALPYVEGGNRELARYERIIRQTGVGYV